MEVFKELTENGEIRTVGTAINIEITIPPIPLLKVSWELKRVHIGFSIRFAVTAAYLKCLVLMVGDKESN